MPELPDVQVYKEYLDATSLHHRVKSVEVRSAMVLAGLSARELKREVRGRVFERTRRHGKHLFVALDAGGWLAFHFGMTGGLKYYKDEAERPHYAQVLFLFANGYHLAYVLTRKLGRIRLVADPDDFIKEKRLGPDALAKDLDLSAFREALSGRRGVIKTTLMDQHVIAGIGNVYSDEILCQARVHPSTRVDALDAASLKRIHRRMKDVLRTAILARARPEKFPRSYLTRHRGTDDICPGCGGPIRKVRLSGRTSYFCPRCQKRA